MKYKYGGQSPKLSASYKLKPVTDIWLHKNMAEKRQLVKRIPAKCSVVGAKMWVDRKNKPNLNGKPSR